MTKNMKIILGVAIAAVLAGLAVLASNALRSMIPTQPAIDEGNALSAANNRMMAAMMGSGVVYSGDPDDDFAMLMIPHHQGAVDMAKVEAQYGADGQMKDLATRINAAQIPQIAQMQKWRMGHKAAPTADAETEQQAYIAVNNKMMAGMMADGMGHSGKPDVDFTKMMVPHHQGAVELQYGHDPEMRALAQIIITAQKPEIAEMNAWLAKHR